MKLQELGAQPQTQQIARVIRNQSGKKVRFDNISEQQTRSMLARVKDQLKEHRDSSQFYRSEKDPVYLRLMMMEQALASRLDELDTAGAVPGKPNMAMINDPKTKAVMDKVKRGQTLTPDEQKTVNMMAVTQEGKKRLREQSELQQAQVVLASQDMVDRLQGMMEDVSEMQFKDLPALVNSIRQDVGTEQASQFQTAASQALGTLLTAIQAGKTEMEGAQGVITGQAPVVPGQDDAAVDVGGEELPPPDGEEDLDLSLDANLDTGDEDEEVAADLGRERR